MHILLVAPQPFYQERGTPIAVRMLVEVLCGQGHAVDLLTYHEGANLDIDGLRILRTPALPGLRHVPIGISWKKLVCDLLLTGRLLGLALTRHYDVIHAVEEAVFPAMRSSARTRVVYDMDSMLGEQLVFKWRLLRPAERALRAMERAVIRRADAVFAVCGDLARHVTVDAPGVPVFLIEDVALPSPQFNSGAEPLRELLDIRGPLALYVGNLQGYQGYTGMRPLVLADVSSRSSAFSEQTMARASKRLVICIENAGFEVSLERRKIYIAIPDARAARFGQIRVIDESGEDYLYPEENFIVADLPQAMRRAVLQAD